MTAPTCFLSALLFAFACESSLVWAENEGSAPAPMPLIDFSSPDAGKQVQPAKGVPAGSTVTVDKAGIVANFTPRQKGDADHPGFHVFPAAGKFWDLSAYGHVEAKITNTGDRQLMAVMHVSDEGDGYWSESKLEFATIKPGETKTLRVIFGYQKGFKPGPAVKTDKIQEIFFFLYSSPLPHSFRVEELKAAGVAGEQPVSDAQTTTKP